MRKFLNDLDIAQDFLDVYLQPEIKKQCNLPSLSIEPGSYIENNLKAYYSDIVYKVDLLNQSEPAYIYVLIEHQSSAEVLMPFRILRYQLAIIEQYLDKQGKHAVKLPLVVPLVFYNGKRSPYPHSCDINDLFANKDLYQYIKLGKFKLIDLTVMDNEEIWKHQKIALLEVLAKHIYLRDFKELSAFVIQALKHVDKFGTDSKLLMATFSYLMDAREPDEIEFLIEQVKVETPYYEESIMTYAEKLKQEGRQEGLQQGMQQGLLNGKQDIVTNMLKSGMMPQDIAKCTGIPLNQVKEFGKKH